MVSCPEELRAIFETAKQLELAEAVAKRDEWRASISGWFQGASRESRSAFFSYCFDDLDSSPPHSSLFAMLDVPVALWVADGWFYKKPWPLPERLIPSGERLCEALGGLSGTEAAGVTASVVASIRVALGGPECNDANRERGAGSSGPHLRSLFADAAGAAERSRRLLTAGLVEF